MRSSFFPPFAPAFAIALLASGCAPDDPQLAMCQGLAKQLVANVAAWEGSERSDGARARDVTVTYSTTDERTGSLECRYPVDRENGRVATAPDQAVLDGRRLSTGELLAAGTKASGKLIADTADATADRTRELADDAADTARDVAGRALDAAVEAGQALQEKLDR